MGENTTPQEGTKFHLHFKNFHPKILEVTEAVMQHKPWKMEDFNEKQALFEQWVAAASKIYDVVVPEVQVYEDEPMLTYMGAMYDAENIRLYMRKHSLVSLFFTFRLHCLHVWAAKEGEDLAQLGEERNKKNMRDAAGWACSLFYLLRPYLFRRSVREGKILLVHPRDLLTNPEEYHETPEGQLEKEFNEIMQHGWNGTEDTDDGAQSGE